MGKTQQEFARRYNELLGNRQGRPETGNYIFPKYTQKDFREAVKGELLLDQLSSRGFSTKKPKKPQTPVMTEEEWDKLRESELKSTIEEATGGEDKGFLGGLRDFGSSVGGKALDIVSRPAYALFEGWSKQADALQEGEPLWSSYGDFLKGASQGIQGKEKTGYGEVIEKVSEPGKLGNIESLFVSGPFGPFAKGAEAIAPDEIDPVTGEETVPAMQQWMKRLMGVSGEVGLDPLNFVGGGVAKVLKGVNEVADASRLGDEAVEQVIKHLPDNIKGKKFIPTQVDEAGETIAEAAWRNRTDLVADAARNASDEAILEIKKGTKRGTLKLGGDTYGPVVASRAAQTYRDLRLEQFEMLFQKFKKGLSGQEQLTPLDFSRMRRDPVFRAFLTNLNKTLPTGPFPKNWDELAEKLRKVDDMHDPVKMRKAAEDARTVVTKEAAEFQDKLAKSLTGHTYTAPGVRIFGTTIPFKRVGKAYDTGITAYRARRPARDIARNISYEHLFPGRLSLLSQKTKGMGTRAFEELRTEAVRRARQLTRDERKLIQRNIELDEAFLDPRLEEARLWIKEQYRNMADEEISMGVRNGKEVLPSNYTYVFPRGGDHHSRIKFRADRKSSKDMLAYGTDAAKRAKIRPVEDAFESMLLRKMKSNRDLTRAWFTKDLLDHYGFMSTKATGEAKLRGLKRVKDNLPEDLKKQLGKGESWYLPEEMHRVLQDFFELSRLNNTDAHRFLRLIDNISNKFKASTTLPFPGFHLRNMIGDVYMGFMDGVPSSTYTEVMNKYAKTKKGLPTSYRIGPGWVISHPELVELYMKNASSGGFYKYDLGGGAIRSIPNRGVQFARDVSEHREDFGRFVHFLHALRDEFPANSVGRNAAKNKQRAIEQAVFRVNKYKFDYGALTKFERNTMKRIMPFYTYTRKAIPTLVESLFLNPRQFSITNRLMEQSNSDIDNFRPFQIPTYRREMGYATLSDEENPWIMDQSFLPTNLLNFGEGEDLSARLRSLAANVNPLLLAPFEMASETQYFTDAPIESNIAYLADKFAPYAAGRRGAEGMGERSILEQILSNRFGAGLPIGQVSDRQQSFALQDARDVLIDEPFAEFNKANEGKARIYYSQRKDGSTVRVKNSKGEVVYEGEDPKKALEYAKHLASRS